MGYMLVLRVLRGQFWYLNHSGQNLINLGHIQGGGGGGTYVI